MNQHGRGQFQKLTYSVDMDNPDAMSSARGLESMLRSVIQRVLAEGAPVMHTQRYTSGTQRNTDYYVPAGHAENIRNALADEIARREEQRGRNLGINLSSASDSTFRTQTAMIRDARLRAELAASITQHGGYFSTLPNGMSSWGIDSGVKVTGSGGRNMSLASSVTGRIGSSNAAWRRNFEELMSRADGQKHSYSDYDESEIGSLMKKARRTISKNERREESMKSEGQQVYDRLARRGRMVNYNATYAREHPDDPIVKARKAAADRSAALKKRKKITGGARTAKRVAESGIGIIIGALVTAVGLLSKIGSLVADLRGTLRDRGMTAMSYNFGTDTMRRFGYLAEREGFDKNLLGQAAGAMLSTFGDPGHYSDAAFAKAGLFMQGGTSKLTSMATAGGDQNTLGMIEAAMNRADELSMAGNTPTKRGMTVEGAMSVNLDYVNSINPALGAMTQKFLYDKYFNPTRFKGGAKDWLLQYDKSQDKAAGLADTATRSAAEAEGNRLKEIGAEYKSFGENLLTRAIVSLSGVIESLSTMLARFLDKMGFHGFGAAIGAANAATNSESQALIDKILGGEQNAASAVYKKYGIAKNPKYGGGPIDVKWLLKDMAAGHFKGPLGLTNVYGITEESLVKLARDPAAIDALTALADTQETSDFIQSQRKEAIPEGRPFDAARHGTNASSRAAILLERLRHALGVTSLGSIDEGNLQNAILMGDIPLSIDTELTKRISGSTFGSGKLTSVYDFLNDKVAAAQKRSVDYMVDSASLAAGGTSTLDVYLHSTVDGREVVKKIHFDTNMGMQQSVTVKANGDLLSAMVNREAKGK
jgi:hypothetical protein